MKKAKYFAFIAILIIIGIAFFLFSKKPATAPTHEQSQKVLNKQLNTNSNNMKITSPVFENNGNIPAKFTCDGEGISPPLEISDAPENTKSLVLIVDDPDAPAGDWVHWTVWNIKPDTKLINENSIPPGATEGITDFGKPSYGGPCPPSGTHHYQFKLYALDINLDLNSSIKKVDIEKAIEGHILGQALLVGLYQR